MTVTSTPALASVEAMHIPYKIDRRTAELYFQLLAALLAHQDRRAILDHIESDGVGGWYIHFACDRATIDLLREVAVEIGDRSNPLWLLA
jgi:hypothetical protein